MKKFRRISGRRASFMKNTQSISILGASFFGDALEMRSYAISNAKIASYVYFANEKNIILKFSYRYSNSTFAMQSLSAATRIQ
jgi:hypothetical protein